MDIIDFILARYNYWIFITLMMTGLYIVISRGNLVKTIIGLNLFQTSVFIFYISIGKIVGGTAPILLSSYGSDGYESGGDHGDNAQEAGHGSNSLDADTGAGATSPDGAPLHSTEGLEGTSNSLTADPDATTAKEAAARAVDSLHDTQSLFHSTGAETQVADAAAAGFDVVYTNPLPHVLILTAIVVGVATTAVGLALAVRIREAYGTIEEDELEAEDHFAEFGVPLHPQDGGA